MPKNKSKYKDSQRRSNNYKLLTDAGFNSREANRFKDYSDYKIQNLIEEKHKSQVRIDAIAGGTSK